MAISVRGFTSHLPVAFTAWEWMRQFAIDKGIAKLIAFYGNRLCKATAPHVITKYIKDQMTNNYRS